MYDCILVPLDGSPTAQRGFAEAQTLAKKLGAALRLLYVVDAQMLVTQVGAYVPIEGLLTDWQAAGEKLMAEAVAEARAAGLQADSVVRCEVGQRVSDAILQEAKACGARLIVMGTHGRRGLRRMALGSDAEQVLRESPVPVLLVRNPDAKD